MAITTTMPQVEGFHVDDETIALAKQLEEIGLSMQESKGKYPMGSPPDWEVAFQSFQAELATYQCFLEDQKLAQSIAAAVHEDSAIIADLTSKDLQSHQDRRMALGLSDEDSGSHTPLPHEALENDCHDDDDLLSIIAETVTANSVIDFSDDEDQAGPSMTFAQRQAMVLTKMATEYACTACRDRFPSTKTIKPDCEHRYCTDCACELFLRATKDETLFPPRCCRKAINPLLVKRYLSAEQASEFEAAALEYSTINRIYCSNRQCGEFIPPTSVDARTKAATCGSCGNYTCTMCKNEHHGSGDCPDDPELRQTRALAKEEGWQACPRCDRLVQLRSGCNHITCHCRAEFCYVCGVAWKNCNCQTADEHRMLERAEEVVDRAGVNLPVAERNRQVRRVQAQLRDNHECEHPGRFRRIFNAPRRGFRCEVCDARHWKYILQCRHCFINACEDCRRHRV